MGTGWWLPEARKTEEWYEPTSTLRIAFATAIILAALVFMVSYFSFAPFSTSDRLSVWVGAEIICLLLFLAFYVGFDLETKQVVVGASIWLIWSIGLLVLPLPEGYGEAVLGGWAALLGVIIVLYVRYRTARCQDQPQTGKTEG
jgi:hypothetical protein